MTTRRHFTTLLAASPWAATTTLSAGLLLATHPAHAQIATLGDAVDKSKRLYMLSQRAAKAYFAIALNVRAAEAQKVLDLSAQQFDRTLIELKNYTAIADARKTYTQIEGIWSDIKGELMGKAPNKTGALSIDALNSQAFELLGAASETVQKVAKSPSLVLEGLAGELRMYSQRLTKNYFRRLWGVLPEGASKEILEVEAKFLDGHKRLLAAAAVGSSIRADLEIAANQWVFVDNAINSKTPDSATKMSDVWSASENILQVMDKLVTAYARAAAA